MRRKNKLNNVYTCCHSNSLYVCIPNNNYLSSFLVYFSENFTGILRILFIFPPVLPSEHLPVYVVTIRLQIPEFGFLGFIWLHSFDQLVNFAQRDVSLGDPPLYAVENELESEFEVEVETERILFLEEGAGSMEVVLAVGIVWTQIGTLQHTQNDVELLLLREIVDTPYLIINFDCLVIHFPLTI